MSEQYDKYLVEHEDNVERGWQWLRSHFPDMVKKMEGNEYRLASHDSSKFMPDEYVAYDKYFYGGNKSYQVVQDFNKAWLLHIHRNPHHWEYWVLQQDGGPEILIEMPYWYIVEMICDWWSFSWKSGNLYEIFDWYEKNKGHMKLNPKTRKTVEDILKRMREELDRENKDHLEHHGVKGQKWGVLNGPPYPIKASSSQDLSDKLYSDAEKREPAISKDVQESAAKVGSKMYGLEHRLKTKDSLHRKINVDSEEKEISVDDAASDIKDAVRYTTISSGDKFVGNYIGFKEMLESKGYKEVRCKNYFDLYNQGKVKHKSVQSVFETPDGYKFEVQFQTPESQEAKDKKVPIYEERRKAGLSRERQIELEKEMEELAEKVPEPKDIQKIKTH